MKNLTWLLLIALFVCFLYQASAQVTNLNVNGFSANFTIAQGDSLIWEYNLPVGGTANGEIWIDLNGNGIIDSTTDKLMFGSFTQTDGQNGDKGPGDMDSLVNGHIYFALGNDGVAPAKYVLRFTNGGIAQSVAGTVTALPSPTYTVSGKVTPPASVSGLNILVGAQEHQNGGGTGWWALTDASGNYTINFNASAGGVQWGIQVQDQFPPYVVSPTESTITLTGNISGLDFSFAPAAAKVYGYFKGEDGHIFANVQVDANPFSQSGGGNNKKGATTDQNGFYEFGFTSNEISSTPLWQLEGSIDGVAPQYFPPQSSTISLHQGDTLRVDLTAFVADDSITGNVTMDGHAPNNHSFQINAGSQDSGNTRTNSDPLTGNFTLHVTKKIHSYYINVDNQSLPNGYGVNQYNLPAGHAGDKNYVISIVRIAWFSQSSNTNNSLNAISFVNPTTGWVAGSNGTVSNTTDAGATWTGQTTSTPANINGIYFVNTTTGWIVGDGGVIKKTMDGGSHWTSQNSTTTNSLYAVQFIDTTTGWIACGGMSSARILKTTDGGASWSNHWDTGFDLFSLSFVNSQTGWVVGGGGTILKTTDGGSTWNPQSSLEGCDLRSVCFVDSTTGWAVGSCGNILVTTSGGSNWTPQMSGGCGLLSVYFVNSTTGWAVGSCGGNIWGTTNGGALWTNQANNAYTDIYAVQFVDARTGWAVGGSGIILHDTSGIILSVRENKLSALPGDFSLLQNYPNPFNPTTIIRFSLPKSGYVTLKVYNLLGQEIETLVNGERTAGGYNIEWHPSGLTSGVYFYRLSAGSYSEIKKMLFLK